MEALYDLALKQEELDSTINKNKNIANEDLYTRKKIALLVELGELANELRFFKFWSWTQTPKQAKCETCKGSGVELLPFGELSFECYTCKGDGLGPDKVLEEYIDCVHFTLSICLNHHKYTDKQKLKSMLDRVEPLHYSTLEDQFSFMFGEISNTMYSNMRYIVSLVMGLGKMLGYSTDEIVEAYHIKHAINISRQEENY